MNVLHRSWNILGLLFVSLLVVCMMHTTNAEKRRKNQKFDLEMEDYDESLNKKRGKHEFKKYSKEFSDETVNGYHQKQKSKNRKLLDLENVNEDELTSDELQVLEYRRKKLERQNKKTLSDVFEEKKQKKKQRKQKFEKNVLKHFKNDDDDNDDDAVSSEEVITPLKRVQTRVEEECDSSEERCP